MGMRCVSCARRPGSGGVYVMRPLRWGGVATTTYFPVTTRWSLYTSTLSDFWSMWRAGLEVKIWPPLLVTSCRPEKGGRVQVLCAEGAGKCRVALTVRRCAQRQVRLRHADQGLPTGQGSLLPCPLSAAPHLGQLAHKLRRRAVEQLVLRVALELGGQQAGHLEHGDGAGVVAARRLGVQPEHELLRVAVAGLVLHPRLQ